MIIIKVHFDENILLKFVGDEVALEGLGVNDHRSKVQLLGKKFDLAQLVVGELLRTLGEDVFV